MLLYRPHSLPSATINKKRVCDSKVQGLFALAHMKVQRQDEAKLDFKVETRWRSGHGLKISLFR